MSKKIVKRCIRPQCMEIYSKDNTNKYCDCGALLQVTEIEIPDRKLYGQRKELVRKDDSKDEKKTADRDMHVSPEKTDSVEKSVANETSSNAVNESGFDFFGESAEKPVSVPITPIILKPSGHLYLIPENEDEDEVEYKLGQKALIGRSSDTMSVDVDLSQFGGLISRKHALITYEQDGFYITNLSENHSVHVNNKVVVNGQKKKLESEDGVILSKKVLLQFEEGE